MGEDDDGGWGSAADVSGGAAQREMHAVLHDAVQDAAYARARLTLTVDLLDYANVVLKFWAKEFGDEP